MAAEAAASPGCGCPRCAAFPDWALDRLLRDGFGFEIPAQLTPNERRVYAVLRSASPDVVPWDRLVAALTDGDTISVGIPDRDRVKMCAWRIRHKITDYRVESVRAVGYALIPR